MSLLIKGLAITRVQNGTQNTTAVLTVLGAAIEGTTPFKVTGMVSLHNMVVGDSILVVEEVRDQDDANYREYSRYTYTGVQTSPMVHFDPKLCQGWRIRVQRTGGVDRSLAYQYLQEVV